MHYQRKKEIVARSVAGENVLIPVHGCTRSVYTLNATGCFLWDLLEHSQTAAHLADKLIERYGITPEAAGQDVTLFLDDLIRMGLVVVSVVEKG